MNQLFSFKSLKEFNGDLYRKNLIIELEKQKIERNEKTKGKRKYEVFGKRMNQNLREIQ